MKKRKNHLQNLYQIFENDAYDWKHILTTGKSKVNEHLEGTGITLKHPDIEMRYVGRVLGCCTWYRIKMSGL